MIWFAKENENYEDWIVKKYRGLRIPAFILALLMAGKGVLLLTISRRLHTLLQG